MEEKKHLITYDNGVILSISDAPTDGVIACGTNMLISTLENAKLMFESLGIDTIVIDEKIQSEQHF